MLFVATNLLLLYVVWRVLPHVAPEGGPWTRLTAGFVLGMGLATGVVLVLGVLRVLWAPAQLGVLVVLAGLATAATWNSESPEVPSDRVTSFFTTVSGAMFGATMGLWYGRPGWNGTSFCFDDITYHAAIASQWLQWGAIDYTPFSYQSYYAFNSELLSLWFMVPVGDPSQAALSVLLFVGLVVCATLSIGESEEIPVAVTLGLLAAMFASNRLLYFARTFSSTDLAMTAYVLGALAFALRPPTLRTALWCGVAGGLAIGTKVSAVPAMGLVGLVWVWRARSGRVSLPAVFTAGLLVFGTYWYARNLVHTGNPLFPATVGPFEGPLEPEAAKRTSVIFFIEKKGDELAFWIELVRGRLNWPEFLGYPALVGYLVAGVAGFWKQRRGLWLVAAVGIAFLLLFPFQPFSATVNRPGAPMHSMIRYLTLVFVLGLPLLGGMTRKEHWSGPALTLLAWVGVIAAAVVAALSTYGPADALWMLAGASFALIAMGFSGSAPTGSVPALFAVGLLIAAVRGPEKREFTEIRRYRFSPIGRLHKRAWAAIDALPAGSDITWISDMPPTHTFNLPLMGNALQHRIVPVDRHGKRIDRLYHERWRDEPDKWWWQFYDKPAAHVPTIENLLRSGADYLVLSRCHRSAKGGWPRPHAGLVQSNSAARLHSDRCVEIWDIDKLRGIELEEPRRVPRTSRRPRPKGKSKGKKGKSKGKNKRKAKERK